jgi:TRAP transporter 4TM/12TM fusion protein
MNDSKKEKHKNISIEDIFKVPIELKGNIKYLISFIAMFMSIFHLYTGTFGLLIALRQRSLHLLLGLVLIYFLYPSFKNGNSEKVKSIHKLDILLIILSILATGYMFIYYPDIMRRPSLPITSDLIAGGLCILLILEAARRTVGITLPIVASIFLLYAYFGNYFPGFLYHRGFSLKRIIDHMYMGTEGIFGIPIGVSASFVYLFILFGAFLGKCGLSEVFIKLASALAGKSAGGPAKVAVISSAFMGSISGSSIANVVSTGAFTIPLMKQVGYDKNFAGAVEAAASTGGQILPPVMGAAAFIMAEFLGIGYLSICAAAAIPAIIYFFSVGLMVHFRAKKIGLSGMKEVPNIKPLLIKRGYLFLPVIVIVYFLIAGYTPLRAAVMGIFSTVIVGLINRMKFRDILNALEEAAYNALTVVAACATAGMIVGVVTLTGIGLKLAHMIVSIAGNNLLLGIFFTMGASIILGMGLPTTAKYIVLVTIAGPALVRLGVIPLAAHLVVFYFGIFADITPPVAVAAYAAAGLSGGNAIKTGYIAFRLASAGFLVPYVFAFDSGLLGINTTAVHVLILISTTIMGVISLAGALEGYLISKTKIYEQILLAVGAFLLINPNTSMDILGIVILLFVIILQKLRIRKIKD